MNMARKTLLTVIFLILASNSLITAEETNYKETKICKKCDCNKDLKLIDCSNKSLSTIFSDDDWVSLTDTGFIVETLDLSHNYINNVTQFPSLPIKYLTLHMNAIRSIVDFAFRNLTNLETLDLSHCELTKQNFKSDALAGFYNGELWLPLKNLKALDLSSNGFHTLDSKLFDHLSALEKLDLHENPFKVIDIQTQNAISSLSDTIKWLDLSGIQVQKLPDHIFHAIKTLEVLNISDNAFHQVPEALAYATNLKQLVISANPFSVLDDFTGFPIMEKLEKLSLSYINQLEYIGKGAFSNLTNLRTFECVENLRLKEIDVDAFSRPGAEDPSRKEWPPIENLYLHHNNLSYLDENMLAGWEMMKIVDIRGNNWSCDCKNNWVTKILIPYIRKHNFPVEDLVCSGPPPMAGRKLKEISEKNLVMRCLDKYGNHPERDAQILIGLLLGICIGVPLTLIVLIFYKRGCFGLIRPRGPADFSRAYYQRAGVYDDTMHHI